MLESYDGFFITLRLQEYNLIDNQDWYTRYKNNYDNFSLYNWDGVILNIHKIGYTKLGMDLYI